MIGQIIPAQERYDNHLYSFHAYALDLKAILTDNSDSGAIFYSAAVFLDMGFSIL